MNELLQAAKAVIDLYDYTGPLDECEAINRLIAAVERAENAIKGTDAYEHGYMAGQKAMKAHERERIKVIVREVTGGFGNCDRLMEKIDDA